MHQSYISKAPARVCLFGDHQDYLELPIIACAIDRYISITAKPNDQNIFNISLLDLNKKIKIDLNEDLNRPLNGDFLRLALRVLARHGYEPNKGYDICISGDVPINSGLSSSSALTIAWIQFVLSAFASNEKFTLDFIARLAYETEVLEQNSSGGKMDQYSISVGGLIYLDTKTDEVVSIPSSIEGMIIGVSGISKDTLHTLGDLKSKAIRAIDQIKTVYSDFDIAACENDVISNYRSLVDEGLEPIFEAAVMNHNITLKAKSLLELGSLDYESIGQLMNQHHKLLKENLQITVPRIDAMIDAAMNAGAYGSKIVGSGGGGCIVALSPKGREEKIVKAILDAGAIDAFQVSQSIGASIDINEEASTY